MNAQEIIDYIANSEKKTPVKVYVNTTGPRLPSTGGPGVAQVLSLGTVLTLGAGAMLLLQKRRKEGDAA